MGQELNTPTVPAHLYQGWGWGVLQFLAAGLLTTSQGEQSTPWDKRGAVSLEVGSLMHGRAWD